MFEMPKIAKDVNIENLLEIWHFNIDFPVPNRI